MNIFVDPIKYRNEIVLQVNLNDVIKDIRFDKHCGYVNRQYAVDTPIFNMTFDETIDKIIIPKIPYAGDTVSYSFRNSVVTRSFNYITRKENFINNNFSHFFYYIERAIRDV